MYKKELLESIKNNGEGLVILKRDYKIVLEKEKKQAELEKTTYDYSMINSVSYDGENMVKICYANYPTDNEDFLKRYTNLKNLIIGLDEIENLNFIK